MVLGVRIRFGSSSVKHLRREKSGWLRDEGDVRAAGIRCVKAPLEIENGRRASGLLVRRAHLGRMFDEKRRRSPEAAARSRPFSFCTSCGPIPVWIARTGSCPCRTTRWRPSASTSSAVEARNVSNCKCRFDFPLKRRSKIPKFGGRAISRRAPVRCISVSGSSIAPFCRRATTLFYSILFYFILFSVMA